MPVFNQNRSRVVQIVFACVILVIVGQLVNLQLFSAKYKLAADNNAFYRKVVYPDRGIIFDRKKKAILENAVSYDLIVIPADARGTDTLALCNLLDIDTATYRKRMREIIFKNTSVKPSVFEALLTPEMYAKLNENMYKFPGFALNERSVRSYPYDAGAAVLGYIAEVDTGFLRRHKEEGYEMGDYVGRTGLENTYEKVLMGQRGIKRYIRDNRGRIQGSWENGAYDTTAIAGKNLYSSIDVELQKLGETLMTNKVGSIVAIDPKTGGILCMVSAPTYNPNYLTGNQRRKHFSELFLDPRLPLLNRTIATTYSPGSTFKTVVGIAGLTEGVINEREMISCPGYFTGCGTGKPKCLDKGVFNFKEAVAHSDNTYFSTVYKRILDQRRYGSIDSSLTVFNKYAYSFGLGHRLGIDLPSEKKGNIPTPQFYRNPKVHGAYFQSCNIISNAIGQGEVSTTLAQLANVMAIIANRGWYYAPHLIDSIEGGDEFNMLEAYKTKHHTANHISDSVFEAVQDGMQAVVEYGTAVRSRIPGINMCGKTGTVENYAKVNGKVEKQIDHSFFGAFAPRENPKIAIAVICENAGQGAWAAAPIASLLVEKYLRDSISGTERKAMLEEFTKKNLIPALMRKAIAARDSSRQAKESEAAKKAMRDTSNIEEEPDMDTPPPAPVNNSPKPNKDKQQHRITTQAILPDDPRKFLSKRTASA